MKLHQTEAQFQAAVLDAAAMFGWLAHHQRPARVKGPDGQDSWRSAIAGDAGFPDLVLARVRGGVGRLILAELKSDRGRVALHQQVWLDVLETVPGIEVHVWRPADMDTIVGVLR